MKYWVFLHLIGVVLWVGGMFFAYMALRPAAAEILEPPLRLPLWAATLRRFFPWVWVCIALILASGLAMVAMSGGFGAARWNVHAMFTLGLIMMGLFAHLYFAPFRRLCRSVAAQDWKVAGPALAQIRKVVGTNLVLGLITTAIALLGRLA